MAEAWRVSRIQLPGGFAKDRERRALLFCAAHSPGGGPATVTLDSYAPANLSLDGELAFVSCGAAVAVKRMLSRLVANAVTAITVRSIVPCGPPRSTGRIWQ